AIVVVKSSTRAWCRMSASMGSVTSRYRPRVPVSRARWRGRTACAILAAGGSARSSSIPERSQFMKAIRVSAYGGPEVLKLTEVPTPAPGDGQVLVRNHAVGVNPVDTYLRSNTDNRGPKLPYTPGNDSAGVVGAGGRRGGPAEAPRPGCRGGR